MHPTPYPAQAATRITRGLAALLLSLAGIAPTQGAQDTPPAFLQTDPHPILVSTQPLGSNAVASATVNIAFPAEQEIYLVAPSNAWIHAREITVDIDWPADAPTNAQLLAHMMDWDYLWYQKLAPGQLSPGRINQIKLQMFPSTQPWEPRGHTAPWNLRALMEPKDIALRLFCPTPYTGTCRITRATISWRRESAAPFIRNVRIPRNTVGCYERFEAAFELPDRYPNPFDPDKVRVSAVFDTPTGGPPVTVEGFYSRDYTRTLSETGEQTLPTGLPVWKIRFCPTTPGTYRYRLQVRDTWGTAEWGPGTFTATPSRHPGFVRVSPRDRRRYECDDGSFFFAIGHNIRSPFDNRTNDTFPWQQRWPEGSMAYARYLPDMGKHGENYIEIWNAAWSLGLEWIKTWPGYHGIGQYNMMNAWELDRVLEQAEATGIRVNLAIHNHGKFSAFMDAEWALNPFNVANGGYLEKPEQYFTDPRAIQSFLNLMRYTIARWGYSPNIFAWQLWSELNLTGTNPDRSWYRKPECVQWHRLMAQSVKNMDPYKHLVATHFSGDYTEQNKEIDALPEIDHCPLDAYHGSPTAIEIVKLMRETAAFMVPLDKPGLITEFGGNWGAQQGYAHIDHSLHAGLWASTAIPSGGTPMFWWWMIVEEEKLYPRYAALARFMNNVDLRDPTFQLFTTAYTPANITSIVATARSADVVRHDTGTTNAEWRIECFGNATYAQGWMYNLPGFETLTSATSPADDTLAIRFSGLTNPVYDVEFWDTARGMPIQTTRAATRDSILVTPVPPVVRDIAFKLRKANPQSESR